MEDRTRAHLERRSRQEAHPVEDFLYTYYPFTPAQLATWHPGAGVRVELGCAEDEDQFRRRWYRTGGEDGARWAEVDVRAWLVDRGDGLDFISDLLAATRSRSGAFDCFGMHEWAMVYRRGEQRRHTAVPLRLSAAQTDEVVESHRIRCSHFDAFRFFTPPARPLNALTPTREGMRADEQPGCLHAGMDLYKWTMKLVPVLPSELVLDAFDLARDIRVLDMEASPYDVRAWGYGVVAVETPEGKAEYVRRQRGFTERSQALRARMLEHIDVLRSASQD